MLKYKQCGYDFPIRVIDTDQALALRSRFLDYVERNSAQLHGLAPRDQYSVLSETHFAQRWIYDMVSNPNVLDAVEDILGPDLVVWSSRWFSKLPGEKTFVSWHQDATYWGLHPPNVTTAWIALSRSIPENGCMRVIPHTHQSPLLPQNETYNPENALSRGQEIAVEVDESQAVEIVLEPGEMSLHHVGIVHGSKVNTSNEPRIGLAVRYITPDVRQDGEVRLTGMLVRGQDAHGHFEFLPPPESDFDSSAIERRQSIVDRVHASVMRK
jgi:ectoine hydroxylase-related dioxygenase (phytanoyl-CoA dioxygenase family)